MCKCYICDAELRDDEIKLIDGKTEPCGICLEVIENVFDDPVPEEHQKKELDIPF